MDVDGDNGRLLESVSIGTLSPRFQYQVQYLQLNGKDSLYEIESEDYAFTLAAMIDVDVFCSKNSRLYDLG